MYLTLMHDHRLVDGLLGGMFLKYIKDTLEKFDVSIVWLLRLADEYYVKYSEVFLNLRKVKFKGS